VLTSDDRGWRPKRDRRVRLHDVIELGKQHLVPGGGEWLTEPRAAHPVYWQEMRGEPGFWAVLRHADVVHVAREPRLFSASPGAWPVPRSP